MSHQKTEEYIKKPILDLIDREFNSLLMPAGRTSREFPLKVFGRTFKADFAYKIRTGGWCFIEDDSSGTCLSNLFKYSAWIEETNPDFPIWVFHIIAPENSAWIELCRRESRKLNEPSKFHHVIITTPDWPESSPEWISSLQREMARMLNP